MTNPPPRRPGLRHRPARSQVRRFTDAAGRVLVSRIRSAIGRRTLTTPSATSPRDDARARPRRSSTTRTRPHPDHRSAEPPDEFTYFPSNLLQTRTDALTRQESFTYDLKRIWSPGPTERIRSPNTHTTPMTVRRSSATAPRSPGSYTYESTLTLGYDGGWRLRERVRLHDGCRHDHPGLRRPRSTDPDQNPRHCHLHVLERRRRKTMTAGNQAVTEFAGTPTDTAADQPRLGDGRFTYLANDCRT